MPGISKEKFTVEDARNAFKEGNFTSKTLQRKLGCSIMTSRTLIRRIRSELVIVDHEPTIGKGTPTAVFALRTSPNQRDVPTVTQTLKPGKELKDFAWTHKYDNVQKARVAAIAEAKTDDEREKLNKVFDEQLAELNAAKNLAHDHEKKRRRALYNAQVRVKKIVSGAKGPNLYSCWGAVAANTAMMAQEA